MIRLPDRWVLTPTESACLALPCSYCAAQGGEWCMTRSGGEAHSLHEARWALWRHNHREQVES